MVGRQPLVAPDMSAAEGLFARTCPHWGQDTTVNVARGTRKASMDASKIRFTSMEIASSGNTRGRWPS